MLEALVGTREGPSVVAVGGGHGLAQGLRAISRYASRISAIVTVADDGGSSGRLAPALEIPPMGDIRQCLIALTPENSIWRRLFDYRFEGGDVDGHSLGNLIIASLADLEDDFEAALVASERLLGTIGSVIPASPSRLQMEAVVDGGSIRGQVAVAVSRGEITELRVLPADAKASVSALEAIHAADQIVLGPGSLYTSVMAPMLVPGITEAINQSSGKLVYVANLITQDGETLGMDAADQLDALLKLTGVRPPSAIVANTGMIDVKSPLERVKVDREVLETYGVDLIEADLVDPTVIWPRHDPARLGGALARLVTT